MHLANTNKYILGSHGNSTICDGHQGVQTWNKSSNMVKTLGPGYSKWTFYKSVTGTGSSGNPLKFGDDVIIYNYQKDLHKNTMWLNTCGKTSP